MGKAIRKAGISFCMALILLIHSVLPVLAEEGEGPTTYDVSTVGERSELFNDDWKFFVSTNATAGAAGVNFDDSKWEDVDVPHDWQIKQFGASATKNTSTMYATGYGWYRKTFYLPEGDQGKNINIRFDGVYMDINVYINGTMLTLNSKDTSRTWAYGYTGFDLDLTEHLNYGNEPNVIAVRCWYQNSNTRWYTGAGIYRNVWMTKTDPVHIAPDGTYITTDGADGNAIIDTEVINTSTATVSNVSVKQTMIAPDGSTVATDTTNIATIAAGATATASQTLSINNPQLWGLDDPKLYTMKTVVSGDNFNDEYDTQFGFRTIRATSHDGFFLNEEYVKFHGVCMHHDLGALGAAVNYRAVERQLEIMQEMGVNAIRTAHNPATPELLEICDRLGLMVITEAFDCWGSAKNTYDYARFFNNWYDLDIKSWVRRERNHPSVIMWSIGNEVGSAHTGSTAIATATSLHNAVRESDPRGNAYTTYASNAPEDSSGRPMQIGAEVVDIFGYNYLDIGVRTVDFTKWHDKYPNMIIYGSETSSAVRSRGIYLLPDDLSVASNARYQCSSYDSTLVQSGNGLYAKTAEDAWKTARDHKFDLGEFVWTGFDYLGEPSPYGGTTNNGNSKNSYFGIVDTAGLPKDVYYFYQSVWTDKPMLHLLPYWAPVSTISYNGVGSEEGVPIWAYCNADSVELFLNGESLGKQSIDLLEGDVLHAKWTVPYEEGVVEAKAYDKDGNVVATDRIETFDYAAKIDLKPDRQEINADGKDLVFVETSILDPEGVFVANATNRVEFKVEGAGTLEAIDNGDSNDFEAFGAPARKAFSGKMVAIIKSDGTAGPITIKATSPGLEDKSITINAVHKQAATGVTLAAIDETTTISTAQGKLKMVAKVLPADADYQKVAYTVTNEDGSRTDKATINRIGVLTALKEGTVKVTATALDGSGSTADEVITISNQSATTPVTGITVAGASGATTITEKSRNLQMSATIAPAGATVQNVTWSVQNKETSQLSPLATINASSGLLKPLYDGVVTVKATAVDGSEVYGERDITISGQNPVTTIPISKITLGLLDGATQNLSVTSPTAKLQATVAPASATATVDWRIAATEDLNASSPNAEISVDSATGIATVTAKANGTFSVVASTQNGGSSVDVQTTMAFTVTDFEEVTINPYYVADGDGKIKPAVKAIAYSEGSAGVKEENASDPFLGGLTNGSSWVTYKNVDFGVWGSKDLTIWGVNATSSGMAAKFEVREGTNTGKLLGTVSIDKNRSGWGYDASLYQTFTPTGDLSGLTGKHDICFVLATGGGITFYGWGFTENAAGEFKDPYIVNDVTEADYTGSNYKGFQAFDFGEDGSQKVIITGKTQGSTANLEIRDGSAAGALIAGFEFPDTGGDIEGRVFNLYGAPIKGAHNLFITYPTTGFELESVQFIPGRQELVSAYQRIQAEDFDAEQAGYATGNYVDDDGEKQTVVRITDSNNGSFEYKGLDFGAEGGKVQLRIYGYAKNDRTLRFSINDEDVILTKSGASGTEYTTWEYNIGNVTGEQDISIGYFPGLEVGIDWFEFVSIPPTPEEKAAAEVKALINDIGTVELTAASKEKIDTARSEYDLLSAEAKALVDNYAILEAAEETYAELVEVNQAAAEVKTLISGIGTVELTDASKEKIDTARLKYDLLSAEAKALVDNYEALEAAEESYAKLKADKEKADDVINKIKAIGEVTLTEESKERIDAAKEAYGDLTVEQQGLVENYEDLQAAEAKYAELEDDQAVADDVKTIIDAIGTVDLTEESLAKIEAAEMVYNALTAEQKAIVPNVNNLKAARIVYDALAEERDTVQLVIDKINAIPDPVTLDCKDAIDEAKALYEALKEDWKANVSNAADLAVAESSYTALADVKTTDDQSAAAAVITAITAIDKVALTQESKDKIDAAKVAFEALTADQQALVTNLGDLLAAEATYEAVKKEQDVTDRIYASVIKGMIDELGTVTMTEESKLKIDYAKKAYDKLTLAQKGLVTNVGVLQAAEAKYQALVKDKIATDKKAADAVITKINSIGKVAASAASKKKIDDAQAAYNALSADQKKLVTNVNVLNAAQTEYTKLITPPKKGSLHCW